jgi:hypothetical protein
MELCDITTSPDLKRVTIKYDRELVIRKRHVLVFHLQDEEITTCELHELVYPRDKRAIMEHWQGSREEIPANEAQEEFPDDPWHGRVDIVIEIGDTSVAQPQGDGSR